MASANISFDNIPSSIRKPGKYFEYNTKLAVRTLPNNKQRMLIVAQRTAEGKGEANMPSLVFSDAEAGVLFGYGSQCHIMARAAIKANPYLDLTIVGVDDPSAGLAATSQLSLTGTALTAGMLTLYINNVVVLVGIAANDTAEDVAASVTDIVNKRPDLPVTATDGTNGIVILTAKNKGLCGNDNSLETHFDFADGITDITTPFSGGIGSPDLTDAMGAVYAKQYDVVAWGWRTKESLIELRNHLDEVSGPLEQRPGVGVYSTTGSLGATTTLSGQINSGRIVCAYLRYSAATTRRSLPWEIAAVMAAVTAFEEDPAMPLNTLEMKGIAPAESRDILGRTEQESLLYNGVTPLEIGPGEKVQIVRAITSYIVDPQGIEDKSLLDVTTIRSLDYTRKACRERVSLRFPRAKISRKTPPAVRTELKDVLYKLEELEILRDVDKNMPGLLIEDDLQDVNRLNAAIPAGVVPGLHVFAGRIDLLL